MFNEADNFITKMKFLLFKVMLSSDYVFPTVSSKYLENYYKNLFNIKDKTFSLVHDCFGDKRKFISKYKKGDGYVFCGGTNGRDWNLLLEVAERLPSIDFVVVGPKSDTLGTNYPKNIVYYHNIDVKKFQQLLYNSSLSILPLNTNAPAGLIVLYTAGLMSKAVITTNNVTMNEYIVSGHSGVLVDIGDSTSFSEAIELIIKDMII